MDSLRKLLVSGIRGLIADAGVQPVGGAAQHVGGVGRARGVGFGLQGTQLPVARGRTQALAAHPALFLAQRHLQPTGAIAAFVVPKDLDQGCFPGRRFLPHSPLRALFAKRKIHWSVRPAPGRAAARGNGRARRRRSGSGSLVRCLRDNAPQAFAGNGFF